MPQDILYIIDNDNVQVQVFNTDPDVIAIDGGNNYEIVELYEPGPQGPAGAAGQSGSSAVLPPNIVTSSAQIDYSGIQNRPDLSQYLVNSQTGSFVTNAQTASFVRNSQTSSMSVLSASYAANVNLPVNIVSSSQQIKNLLPSGVLSSSQQLPSGIISSSQQIANGLPNNVYSSSAQIGPTGIYSGSGRLQDGVTQVGIPLDSTLTFFHEYDDSAAFQILGDEGSTYMAGRGGQYHYVASPSASQINSPSARLSFYEDTTSFEDYSDQPLGIQYEEDYSNTLMYNSRSLTDVVTVKKIIGNSTSSFVVNNQTGSFITNAQTASFVTNSQTASFVQNNQTGSFITNAQTASFVTNSQTASMSVLSSSYSQTGGGIYGGSGYIPNGTRATLRNKYDNFYIDYYDRSAISVDPDNAAGVIIASPQGSSSFAVTDDSVVAYWGEVVGFTLNDEIKLVNSSSKIVLNPNGIIEVTGSMQVTGSITVNNVRLIDEYTAIAYSIAL